VAVAAAPGAPASLRAAINAWRVDILSTLARYGYTYGGKRNVAQVLGYQETLDYDGYLARYARDGIGGRIVEIPAEATWGTLPRLTEDRELHSETALSRKFIEITERTQVRRMLEKLDVLAGIGRYSVGVIGFRDGRSLEEPVAEGAVGADGVLYLAAFSEKHATPADIDTDPRSPGYGRPSHYDIDFSRGLEDADPSLFRSILGRLGSAQPGRLSRKVHASRLIHVAEGTLEDDVFGRPRLRRVWDRLDDLAKTVGGAAEIFWLTANRGMQFDVDPEKVTITPEITAAIEAQLKEYDSGLRRILQTSGVNIKGLNELGAGNVNPLGVFRVVAAIIIGTTGIPYRMLFGTERGQNINAEDRAGWLEQIAQRRATFGKEVVLQPFIERLVHAGALPKLAREAELFWPPVHDDMRQAEVADITARAVLNHAKARKEGGAAITTGEFRSLMLNLPAEMPEDAEDDAFEQERQRREQEKADALRARAENGNGGEPDRAAMNGASHA